MLRMVSMCALKAPNLLGFFFSLLAFSYHQHRQLQEPSQILPIKT